MPEVLSIRSAHNPRDPIHRVVQMLSNGKLVALPMETQYAAAASSLMSEAVAVLESGHAGPQNAPLLLVVRSVEAALDFVPSVPPHGLRLARHCWPGPAVLRFPVDGDEPGILAALPDRTREAILRDNSLCLRVPANEFVRAVLELTPAPLVATPELNGHSVRVANAQAACEHFAHTVTAVMDDGPSQYADRATVVSVSRTSWELEHEGVISRQAVAQCADLVILFVCTGNTCRSPMAEVLCRKFLAERLGCEAEQLADHGIVIASAGLATSTGAPASAEAVRVVRNRGLDLSAHRSQPVTAQLLQHADHVFTMTRRHRDLLVATWPDLALRVSLLARDGSDILDPYGSGSQEYEVCEAEIERHVYAVVSEVEF